MSYNIAPILLPYEDKNGFRKLSIQVLYKRMKVYLPTDYKLIASHWDGQKVIIHKNKTPINRNVRQQVTEIEERLISALQHGINSPTELRESVTVKLERSINIANFIEQLVEEYTGKFSHGRLKHYTVVKTKLNNFKENLQFSQISIELLQRLERNIRDTVYIDGSSIDGNTVQSNMVLIKSILNKAALRGLIDEKQFKNYKTPKYEQKIPGFINENEMQTLYDFLQAVQRPAHKLSGYYFLLSCYAGYRISDLKAFDYNKMVDGEYIILRAKKNGTIVSMPIHTRLRKVIEYIKDKPLEACEQTVRAHVKDLASLAGIGRRLKVHDGRHGFGMMLTRNGFSIEEVAELLGDTVEIAKIYARICNVSLSKKINERLK